jgi:light-regulated signal transduction histidine kinase (bacteriophytochrome)
LLEVGSGTGTDGQTAYFVRDNGEGFDMAYVNSLFEPFQKLDRTQSHAGHGLGLARVKRIVGKHGGRIWAQGKPASGATIFFTLRS